MIDLIFLIGDSIFMKLYFLILLFFSYCQSDNGKRCNEDIKNHYNQCLTYAYNVFDGARRSSKNPNEPYTSLTISLGKCNKQKKSDKDFCKSENVFELIEGN